MIMMANDTQGWMGPKFSRHLFYMGSYGSLFTVMLLDINKGVELLIYTLKISLTCLNMGHVSRAGTPIFNHISTDMVEIWLKMGAPALETCPIFKQVSDIFKV